MKRIKVFSDYCSDVHMHNTILSVFNLKNSNRYGVDYILTLNDDFTHAIIINKAMPQLTIPKENVIGLSYEPPVFLYLNHEFIEYVKQHVSKYYIGKKDSWMPDEFIESYSYMVHNNTSLHESLIPKTKIMSIIFSEKTYVQGHQYRHTLVNEILKSNLPIDIYGRGCKSLGYTNDSRIKGEFSGNEPYDGYMFHIAIENVSIPEYFSEKIINALLTKCVPIYWGCQHIEQYFPNMTYALTGDIEKDLILLLDICNNCNNYYNKIHIDVEEIKNKINISNLFNFNK